jgi:hypothetical protein
MSKSFCLFASEVAALIGMNRYISADDVRIRLWKRTYPRMYDTYKSKAEHQLHKRLYTSNLKATEIIKRVDAERAVETENVLTNIGDCAPSSIRHTVKRMFEEDSIVNALPPSTKRQKITQAVKLCDDVTSAAIRKVVTESSIDTSQSDQALAILLDNTPQDAATELTKVGIVATKDQSLHIALRAADRTIDALVNNVTVPTVQDGTTVAIRNGHLTTSMKTTMSTMFRDEPLAYQETVGTVYKGIGNRLEHTSIDRFEHTTGRRVHARNDQGFKKVVDCGGHLHTKVVMYGKVDGLRGDDEVVESKQRQNHLFGRVVGRERVQLYTYMFLTGRRKAVLIETHGDEQREYAETFDDTVWSDYMDKVQREMVDLDTILHHMDDRYRIDLLCRTLH